MGAAASLAWSVSWLGYTNTFKPSLQPITPTPGLMSWLANLPMRPRHLRTGDWLAVLTKWLHEDLARSRASWQSIARYMQAHGHYVIYAGICPANYFARRRVAPKRSNFTSIEDK